MKEEPGEIKHYLKNSIVYLKMPDLLKEMEKKNSFSNTYYKLNKRMNDLVWERWIIIIAINIIIISFIGVYYYSEITKYFFLFLFLSTYVHCLLFLVVKYTNSKGDFWGYFLLIYSISLFSVGIFYMGILKELWLQIAIMWCGPIISMIYSIVSQIQEKSINDKLLKSLEMDMKQYIKKKHGHN